jgi:hypothetical protein
MHFARSCIDRPLKVSALFGMISGGLLVSSLAYLDLTTSLWSVGLSSELGFLLFIGAGMLYGLLVIFGSLVVLTASMNIESRRVLAFSVFIASVFAIIGSFFSLSFLFLGPQ